MLVLSIVARMPQGLAPAGGRPAGPGAHRLHRGGRAGRRRLGDRLGRQPAAVGRVRRTRSRPPGRGGHRPGSGPAAPAAGVRPLGGRDRPRGDGCRSAACWRPPPPPSHARCGPSWPATSTTSTRCTRSTPPGRRWSSSPGRPWSASWSRSSGPDAALLAAATCGALGGLVFAWVVRPLWHPHPAPESRTPLGAALLGLAGPYAALCVMALGLGLVEVGVPAVAILEQNRAASGWLLALWSLGSLVGGLVASRVRWRRGPATSVAVAAGGGHPRHRHRRRRVALRAGVARVHAVPVRSGAGAVAGRRLRRHR